MKAKNYLTILILLLFFSTPVFSQWNRIGQEIKGDIQYQQLGYKTAISGDGNRIMIYSLLSEGSYYKGKIQVLDFVDNNWQEVFKIENLNDETSNSIADAKIDISNNGKVIAFSYFKNDEYIIDTYKQNSLVHTFLKYGQSIHPISNDISGISNPSLGVISLDEDGNTLAFSYAYRDTNDNDKPYTMIDIFSYETNNWSKKGETLRGDDYYTDSRGNYFTSSFGSDLDLSGDGNILLIGEPTFLKDNKYYIGRVSVYNYSNDEWNIMGNQLLGTSHTEDTSERFGTSVSLSNDGQRIAIGSQGVIDEFESVARIYKLNNDIWEQVGDKLKVRSDYTSKFDGVADLCLNNDGSIIALSNLLIRTSALNVVGAIDIYQYTNAQWLKRSETKLGEINNDGFPSAISISNDGKRVITSSPYNGDEAEFGGKVRVFENEAVVDRTFNNTYIPDDNFEQALIDLGKDDVLDNYVLTNNINVLTSLNLENKNISDLTGIEAFTALTNLNINDNGITSLNITNNVSLVYLYCSQNSLTNLDLSQNTELLQLNYSDNQISSLDINYNSKLQSITASRNEISSIDVSKQKDLDWLIINENFITEIDLSFNPKLRTVNISDNRLDKIEVKNNTIIESINANKNSLQTININGSANLKTLKIENNQLSSLDLSSNSSLENLFAKNNSLECVQVFDVNYANVVWSSHTDANVTFSTDCSTIWTVNLDPTIVTILMSIPGLDANNDGNITIAEASALTGTLDLSNTGITIIEGLQAFTSITTLNLSGNSITDLSSLTGLTIKVINKTSGKIKTLSKSSSSLALEKLYLSNNQIKSVNLNDLTNLKELDISNNPELITLSLKNGNNNTITYFDSRNTPKLSCIIVDDKEAISLSTWNKDVANNFVTDESDCRNNVLSTESLLQKDVNIFPNPVTNFLTIESSKEFDAIEIYNGIGKRILKTKERKIDFSNFTSGIYIMRIIAEQKVLTKKVIKN